MFESDPVWSIAVDRNNTKWFCSNEHVISFDGVNFGAYKVEGGYCVFPDSKNTIWSGGLSHLVHFNGTEWEYIEYSSPCDYNAIGEDRQGVLWFGHDDGVKSFDGTNWMNYDPLNVGIQYVYAIAVDKNNVKWFGTVGSIWSFDDKTWKWYDGGERGQGNEFYPGISDIEIDSDGIIWTAGSEGLMTFSPDTGTGVNQSHKPEKIQIINVSPNPFNTFTAISFTIPSSCHAALAVYSLTGQRVRSLVSGPLSTGSHSAFWDGRDDSGRLVSSGVYLFRIEADGKNAAGKMLFLK